VVACLPVSRVKKRNDFSGLLQSFVYLIITILYQLPVKLYAMFKSALIVMLSLSSLVSYSQENVKAVECAVLKEGKFLYLDSDDETGYVEISGKNHIEKSGKDNYYIESTVEWISDCSYIMTMTKNTKPNFPFKPGDTMRVDITRVKGDIIYYTSTVQGITWKGRFKKIK
jgi:hypothetical protein